MIWGYIISLFINIAIYSHHGCHYFMSILSVNYLTSICKLFLTTGVFIPFFFYCLTCLNPKASRCFFFYSVIVSVIFLQTAATTTITAAAANQRVWPQVRTNYHVQTLIISSLFSHFLLPIIYHIFNIFAHERVRRQRPRELNVCIIASFEFIQCWQKSTNYRNRNRAKQVVFSVLVIDIDDNKGKKQPFSNIYNNILITIKFNKKMYLYVHILKCAKIIREDGFALSLSLS